MPFMKNGKRDYKRENELYNSKPEQKKNRAERNKARRMVANKVGKTAIKGKDIDHKTPISHGGLSQMYNLQAVSISNNRSFSRTKDGKLKSQTSKRERKK